MITKQSEEDDNMLQKIRGGFARTILVEIKSCDFLCLAVGSAKS